jgi:hypothetical protein
VKVCIDIVLDDEYRWYTCIDIAIFNVSRRDWQYYLFFIDVLNLAEPEIPDITQEEEAAEGEGGEQAQGDAAPAEDAEPKEQALGVSTPTGEAEEGAKKGQFKNICIQLQHILLNFYHLKFFFMLIGIDLYLN